MEVELITVPVTFLIGIEDKMKHLRESLIGKQAVLTKVRAMMINTMLIMKFVFFRLYRSNSS